MPRSRSRQKPPSSSKVPPARGVELPPEDEIPRRPLIQRLMALLIVSILAFSMVISVIAPFFMSP